MALWQACGLFTAKTGAMLHRARIISALVIIIIVSGLDFQYLSMYPDLSLFSENTRRAAHFLALVIIMFTGAYAIAKNVAWIRIVWWYAYIFAIIVLLLAGILAHPLHISYNVLLAIFNFRIFFCSPLPLAILYIFSRLGKRLTT
jgi:hypothetical protein